MSPRLNLLPWRERQRVEALRRLHRLLLGSLCVALVGVMLVDRLAHQRLERQVATRLEQQAQIQALSGQLAELHEVQAAHEGLRAQLVALARLGADQSRLPRLMAEVEGAMLQGMQLTRLDLQDGRLQVNGLALSPAVLAQFMRGLQRSSVLHDIELKQVVGRTEGDAFELVARVSPS